MKLLRVFVFKEYCRKFSAFFKDIVGKWCLRPCLLKNVEIFGQLSQFLIIEIIGMEWILFKSAIKHTNANMIRGHSHCVFLLLAACGKSLLSFRNVWMDWIDGTVFSWRLCMNALLHG